MATPAELQQWKRDEAAVFEGWDFSYLADRASQDEPPWSYRERAVELVRSARHLLDVDTGGGEFLSSLAPLPSGTKAIESYPANVTVARGRLSPLNVEVSEVAVGAAWPFDDASFDLILNRHGHLNGGEIGRTLMPGGTFFTQQVGSGNLADLVAEFGGSQGAGDNSLQAATAAFRAAGLEIVKANDWSGHQSFRDIGALVYFLKAIPWVVPAFSVDLHVTVLDRLNEEIRRRGILTFPITRFMIEARKGRSI